ncbi:MAG: hypothetical protein ACOC1I_01410 [Spirochaetota bacterium]
MKKLAVVFVILLILGGVVFYFGWIQIQIPSDGYGVIFSRTNGWEEDVIEPGSFAWRWQRLLPTNFELYVFRPEPHRTSVSLSGALPSSSAIETILQESGEFSYELRVDVQTRIRAGELPSLARRQELRPDDLDAYYDEIDARISTVAQDALMGLIQTDDGTLSLDSRHESVVNAITSRIESQVPSLEVVAVTPRRIELPDLELYATAKELATSILEARAQSLREAAREVAQNQAQSDSGIELLERYGEILDRFPVLLEYFRMGREIDGDPLNLESIIPQTRQ